MILIRSLGLGGSERQAALIAAGLDRSRFQACVGCIDSEGLRASELKEQGIPIVRFPITSLARPDAIRQGLTLARYIRRERIDLAHTFDAPMAMFAAPFARLARVPRLLTSARASRELTPQPGHRRLLRLSDRLANGVVVNCDYMKRQLMEEEGVPESKVRLCRNGLDLDEFVNRGRERPKEFSAAGVVIGVVCALREEKDLPTLISAFARISKQRPGALLAIVGSGDQLARLESHAQGCGCRDRVVFVPGTREVARYLAGIDIFVLPSRSEALSNSIIEAMASGCCVAASDVGGNPELVRPGQTGVLFEPGNDRQLSEQLRLLIDEPERRKELAENARSAIIRDYSRATSINRMTEIYEEYLADCGR